MKTLRVFGPPGNRVSASEVGEDQNQRRDAEHDRERRGHPEKQRLPRPGAVEQPRATASDGAEALALRPLQHDHADDGGRGNEMNDQNNGAHLCTPTLEPLYTNTRPKPLSKSQRAAAR